MIKKITVFYQFLKFSFLALLIVCAFCVAYIFCEVILNRKITVVQKNPIALSGPKISIRKNVSTKTLKKDDQIYPDQTIAISTNGYATLVSNIVTKQPVVFLSIDDGSFKDDSVVKMMKDNNIKASLYLAKSFIADNPDFFKQITANGSLVENHSMNHYLDLSKRSYVAQRAEICGQSDYLLSVYGRRPVFYRPPGGSYNSDTLKAAHDCGMKAVVTWIAKANGGSMQYQIGDKLRPGDIVLMHFRPEFKQDMQAFIDAKDAAGLKVELLEDWLQLPIHE